MVRRKIVPLQRHRYADLNYHALNVVERMQYSETNTFMDGLKSKGIKILLKKMNDNIHSLMKNHAYGFMRVSKK